MKGSAVGETRVKSFPGYAFIVLFWFRGEQIRQENRLAPTILLGATRKNCILARGLGHDACQGGDVKRTRARLVVLSKEVNPRGFKKQGKHI